MLLYGTSCYSSRTLKGSDLITDRSWRSLIDAGYNGHDRKLGGWGLSLFEVDFKGIHQAGVKHQAAEMLSRLPTTEVDESLFDEDVPLLIIYDAKQLDQNTGMDEKNRYSVP